MCVLKGTYVNYFKTIIAFASYKVLKIRKGFSKEWQRRVVSLWIFLFLKTNTKS